MTQYQTTGVGAYSGALNWNAHGTLAKLATADPVVAANQQTCNYAHDDLSRLASVACTTSGSDWNQTFSYDPFGNISKTGSGLGVSFQPTYSATTNRYTALPSEAQTMTVMATLRQMVTTATHGTRMGTDHAGRCCHNGL